MANQVRIGVAVQDGATKPISDIRDAWKRLQTDGAQGLTAGLAAAASVTAFNLAGQAIGKVTEFLGDAVKGAIEDQQSVALLTASIKANVTAHSEAVASIEDTITARQRLGFEDDQQRAGLARLLAATHDAARAQDLLRVAMDLSAFTGQDLVSSSEALIKVDGGHYKVLQSLLGSTKDITTSEEALAAVHAATAGAAENLANTQGGKLKASNIAMNESMEKLGSIILPAVVTGTQLAADALGVVADHMDLILPVAGAVATAVGVNVAGSFGAAAASALGFGTATATAAGEAAVSAAAIEVAGNTAKAAWLGILGPLGLVAGAAVLAKGGIDIANRAINEGSDAIVEARAQYNTLASVYSRVRSGALDTAAGIKELQDAQTAGKIGRDEMEAGLRALNNGLGEMTSATDVSAVAMWSARDAADGMGESAGTVKGAVDALAGATKGLADAAFLLGTTALPEQVAAMADAQAGAGGYSQAMRLAGDAALAGAGGAIAHANALNIEAAAMANLGGAVNGDDRTGKRGFMPPTQTMVIPKIPSLGGGGGGTSQAVKDTKAAADALRNEMKAAYAVAEQAALQSFASIHQGNLDAIKGARDHAYAVAQTTYSLKMEGLEAQKAALYEKSNSEQSALNAEQQAHRMRDLGEAAADAQQSLADAQAGGDPKQIAQAQRQVRDTAEALAEAQAQANIDTEKQQADAAAKEIDAKEKDAKDKLVAAQKDADDRAAQDTENENKRYDALVAANKKSYDLQVEALADVKTLHSKTNLAILAEYDKYLKKYRAKGAEIGQSLLTGLKEELKINLPSLTASTGKDGTTSFAVTGQGAADLTTPGTGSGGDVNLNVTVNVNGSVVDPNSQMAYQIADQIVLGMEKAVKQRGITSADFFGS